MGLSHTLGLAKRLESVKNCRHATKADMLHNSATPVIEADTETFAVRADGELPVCEPAQRLPMAQRYFLFLFHPNHPHITRRASCPTDPYASS